MKKWNESKMMAAIARAKRSVLGRTLCRLAGDRAGGVMMEYVVLGVLVVAAIVVAVIYFGHSMRESIASMSKASQGQTADSLARHQAGVNNAAQADTAGKAHGDQFSDKAGQ